MNVKERSDLIGALQNVRAELWSAFGLTGSAKAFAELPAVVAIDKTIRTLRDAKVQPNPPRQRGAWLKDPRQERPGEKIGGGAFVFRRGDGTGRIRPAVFPFEHPSVESASQEAERVAARQPGYVFDVCTVLASYYCGHDEAPIAAGDLIRVKPAREEVAA